MDDSILHYCCYDYYLYLTFYSSQLFSFRALVTQLQYSVTVSSTIVQASMSFKWRISNVASLEAKLTFNSAAGTPYMLFKGAAATLMRRQDMYVVYLSARLPASQYTAIATQLKGYFLNAYAGEWNVQFLLHGTGLLFIVANLALTKWCKIPGKQLKPWHMGTHLRVLSKSFQRIPTLQGLDNFQKSFSPFSTLDESSLSIGRVIRKLRLPSSKWWKKLQYL